MIDNASTGLSAGTAALIVFLIVLAGLVGAAAGWLIASARTSERWRASTAEAAARHDASAAADKQRIAELDRRLTEQRSMAESLAPMQKALDTLREQVHRAEVSRTQAQEQLRGQLLETTQRSIRVAEDVRMESRRLTSALSRSQVRGTWGEDHLDRLLESSGLLHGVHFDTQDTRPTDAGDRRPDVVIHLAGGRDIVVDAKVPLEHLLHGDIEDDGTFPDHVLEAHAAALKAHIGMLGAKAYWRQYDRSPEFVVLYLPAESLLSMALQAEPALLHTAHQKNVILATPTTLLALLRTIAYGWREEAVAANAREVHAVATELVARLTVMTSHLAKLGKSLGGSVDAFNRTVGAYESRVQVSARRLAELKVDGGAEIDLRQVDETVRELPSAS